MKKSILLVAVIFSMAFIVASCKETKKEEEKMESHEGHEHNADKEMKSADVYQCPMDCEKGKTYTEAGPCPVCKMDLKQQNSENNHASNCTCKQGGECTCEPGKCQCKAETSNEMACAKCEPGSCNCKKTEEVATTKEVCGGKCEPGTCECKA
jgi:hypothetical protein